ncbi:MAG: hypothetical protein M1837_000215 [Sclerophora amabilis]|nr:MAG: hypothetical protein M1837_000215 [Sclerophora amabilis]
MVEWADSVEGGVLIPLEGFPLAKGLEGAVDLESDPARGGDEVPAEEAACGCGSDNDGSLSLEYNGRCAE